MPNEQNKEIIQTLKHNVKTVQEQCVHMCHVIINRPLEVPASNPEEATEKTLCYVDGLRTEIKNSETPVVLDENVYTSQFLIEITEKSKQLDQLAALTQASILDLDTEIDRLKNQIKIAEEAKSKLNINEATTTSDHVLIARSHFQKIKTELHGLFHSLFPNECSQILDLMGGLMEERLKKGSSGYIPITRENYHLIDLLIDMKLVSLNPYNNQEIKLAY